MNRTMKLWTANAPMSLSFLMNGDALGIVSQKQADEMAYQITGDNHASALYLGEYELVPAKASPTTEESNAYMALYNRNFETVKANVDSAK